MCMQVQCEDTSHRSGRMPPMSSCIENSIDDLNPGWRHVPQPDNQRGASGVGDLAHQNLYMRAEKLQVNSIVSS